MQGDMEPLNMIDQNNPYAAPQSSQSSPGNPHGVVFDARGRFVPASLLARFAGAVIDGLFGLAVLVAVGMVGGLIRHGEIMMVGILLARNPDLAGTVPMVTQLIVLMCQGALIAWRGQSIGKMALRTRIVVADGRTANLFRGVILRTLPFTGLAILTKSLDSTQPMRSWLTLVLLLDVLLIFSSTRQCAHDRIAGTFVAKAR